ncbi:Protein of unknown function [Pyronema omphalodes CBS 100304]|uniref:Uncharacterized protein n=1 Tax=Pyronema omphalodes (strain CBS 100304) TaxID=1076935 RepID=U4LCX4_PYROM|nr:Protein of unknown function [Pyronema omphalodes CBS 100304]
MLSDGLITTMDLLVAVCDTGRSAARGSILGCLGTVPSML